MSEDGDLNSKHWDEEADDRKRHLKSHLLHVDELWSSAALYLCRGPFSENDVANILRMEEAPGAGTRGAEREKRKHSREPRGSTGAFDDDAVGVRSSSLETPEVVEE